MAPLQFEHPAGLGSFGKLTSVRQSEGVPRVLVYDVWGCSRGCRPYGTPANLGWWVVLGCLSILNVTKSRRRFF